MQNMIAISRSTNPHRLWEGSVRALGRYVVFERSIVFLHGSTTCMKLHTKLELRKLSLLLVVKLIAMFLMFNWVWVEVANK